MTRKISLLAVAAIGMAMAAPVGAATDAECQDMWKKADTNGCLLYTSDAADE